MVTTIQTNAKLLCSIPAYAASPKSLAIIARRKYGAAGYGQPHRVRLNPAQLSEAVTVGELKFIPDPKVGRGQMRIE